MSNLPQIIPPGKAATAVAAKDKPSALGLMAARLSVEPSKLLDTLKATVFRGATNDELLALCVVANEYQLNPLLRELFAFPGKNGGIVPMVPIDGWTKIVNRQSSYDGVEFSFTEDEQSGKPHSCTCTMYVKERSRAIIVTEYYAECFRKTDPWNQMPRRMLRHKAFIQAARLAFGFSGVLDEDEAKDIAATNFEIPATKTLTEVVVSTPPKEKYPEDAPELQTAGTTAEVEPEPKAPEKLSPQMELANVVTNAGHNFDEFAAWGREMFPNMPWDNINMFDELPRNDATRFLRAHVGLMKALKNAKGAGE